MNGVDTISSLVNIIPYRQTKAWLNYFQIFNSLNFSEHRRKLSSFPNQSRDIAGLKLYVNPNLSLEHRPYQIETLQIFYTWFLKDSQSMLLLEQIRIYCFNSNKYPQEFLKSKNIEFNK